MNPFTVIECEQRTPEWYCARAGRATASKAHVVQAQGKGGAEAVTRRDYRCQLIAECLTGAPQEESYINVEMQRGIDKEPDANAAFEGETGLIVRHTGFLSHNSRMAGCSLDGDVDDFKGLVSYKCPKTATHLTYIRENRLPPSYVAQATHEMWMVPQAEWYEFCSFDDRLPEGLQLFHVRVYRSELEKEIARYEEELDKFLREVAAEVEHFRRVQVRRG